MVDIALIKELRNQTGAGMMDCRQALGETQGQMEPAIEILRKKGEKMAAKKAARIASEGVIAMIKEQNKVAVVGLNCETDFVAKNQDFIQATQELAQELLQQGAEQFTALATEKIKQELIVKIGENLKLAWAEIISGPVINYYLHADRKVGAVVVLTAGSEELAREIAMQITAMNPTYLQPTDIPAEIIAKEKEIYQAQLAEDYKPEEIKAKIIEGKLNKFYQANCLLHQQYIKDDSQTIAELLNKSEAKLEKFTRYAL